MATQRASSRDAHPSLMFAARWLTGPCVLLALLFGLIGSVQAARATGSGTAAVTRPAACPDGASNGTADCSGGRSWTSPSCLNCGGGGGGGPSPIVTICETGVFLQDSYGVPGNFAKIGFLYWVTMDIFDWNADPPGTLISFRQIGSGPSATCPPNPPPCITCVPDSGSQFFQFSLRVPHASIGGTADCPPGSPPNSWCPPSAGQPVHLWVSGFTPNVASVQRCGSLPGIPEIFPTIVQCLRWLPSLQVGPVMWDFDDETVNPTSGQGQRIWGTNYNVPSGIGQTVTHTFDYGSAFDPIHGCIRPPLPSNQPNCQGDSVGPAIPGYPRGTPAFQIQVAINWDLQVRNCVSSLGNPALNCGPWTTADLRQFGSPNPWYTDFTVIPLFVVDGGAVTA